LWWGDRLGCPSSHRKYRDRNQRITSHRVRLATLSRSRPHWLDETLSAHRGLDRTRVVIADQASVRKTASVANQQPDALPKQQRGV
jgi:hypothetical protein